MTTRSPYLSLRQAARPAILAHQLLAGDQERAGALAAECADLLQLTRELLKAAGLVQILATDSPGSAGVDDDQHGDRRGQLLDAYAAAAMAWAKVVGSLIALAGTLLDRGDWDDVRRLASVLADAGETNAATDLRTQLGKNIWAAYHPQLQRISSRMPPAEIAASIETLRTVLLEVPEDFPERNREVNRLLAPLAAAIRGVMQARNTEIPYNSRVEHIATGGVASYPDIVKTSLDELSAEFEGTSG
jgi:hypothetical protein